MTEGTNLNTLDSAEQDRFEHFLVEKGFDKESVSNAVTMLLKTAYENESTYDGYDIIDHFDFDSYYQDFLATERERVLDDQDFEIDSFTDELFAASAAEVSEFVDWNQVQAINAQTASNEADLMNPAAKDQPLATGMGTDKHLFTEYRSAYLDAQEAAKFTPFQLPFEAPETLFDRNGNLYNDELDVDQLVDEMQTYAESREAAKVDTKQQAINELNQKQFKGLKQDIVADGALSVGYFEGVKAAMLNLDPAIIQKTIASAGGWVAESLELEADRAMANKPNEFDNILVTEMVRNLNYQDFKEVAPYFFSYQQVLNQGGDAEIVATALSGVQALKTEIEQGALQKNVRFHLSADILTKIKREPNQQQPLAYNLLTDEVLFVGQNQQNQAFLSLYKVAKVDNELTEITTAPTSAATHVALADGAYQFLTTHRGSDYAKEFVSMDLSEKLAASHLDFTNDEIKTALAADNRPQAFSSLIKERTKQEQTSRKRGFSR
ncbi:hypothetical protein PT274_03480 [Leuconostocaceae bacterium ESL0958]|nr:hypothetical protein [Leuconostocaceae bacterium ESL0958]